jgi:integrase/recombinase XerD
VHDLVIEAVRALADSKGSGQEDYLFANPRNGKSILDVRGAITRICKAAGVAKKVTPHLFRHSIATHLMGVDVKLQMIRQYLGHAQIATTEFYTHVDLGHLRSTRI